MNKELVLDVGIGRGGRYIQNDRTPRIGLDNHFDGLRNVQSRRSLLLIESDIEAILPFKAGTFTHVDILFPQDELLWWLIQDESLIWHELHRVTKKGSEISLVIDAPFMGTRGIEFHGQTIKIYTPHLSMATGLRQAGFKQPKLREMSLREVKSLGTAYSPYAAHQMETSAASTFNLTAKR